MNVTKLKRDASRIKANLKKLPDGSVITTKGIQIHIPAKYLEKNLAETGEDTYVVGNFAYVDYDGFYAVNSTTAMMRIAPVTQVRYVHDNEDFIAFEFPKGSTVIVTTQLIVNAQLPYDIFVHFIDNGSVPWFMSYLDLCKLFSSSQKHAGLKVGVNPAIMELMVATIARSPNDLTKYYRHTLKKQSDLDEAPAYIPFKSVIYGAKTPMSKLLGNYIDQAIPSALVTVSTTSDNVENYLRA